MPSPVLWHPKRWTESGDWPSWKPVLQKKSKGGGLCSSCVGIIWLHHQLCGHKAELVLPQEWAGQGLLQLLLLLKTLLPALSGGRGCGICYGKRIILGSGGRLAGKSHGCPLPSVGDCAFHAKIVGYCLSILQVTFAAIATSKIAV